MEECPERQRRIEEVSTRITGRDDQSGFSSARKTASYRKIRENDVYTEYDKEVLADLVESQKEFQEMYGKVGMPNVLIIFEDAAGLNLYSGKTGTRYIKLITTLRHYNISIWTAIQSYKLLPRTVRVNCTNLITFRICNKQELRKIHEEFPMVGDFNAWFDLFDDLTKEDFSFVHLNLKNPPRFQLITNFDRFVDH